MQIKKLSIIVVMLTQQVFPTVIWNGTNTPTVVNENVDITDNCLLSENYIYIVAEEADVTVTIKKDLTIQAQEENQVINLVAFWPYTVTIKVQKNLEFCGVDNIDTEPLYINMFGDGAIRWEIAEDKKLLFNKKDNSGPTEVWIGLFNRALRHTFKLSDKRQLHFGEKCLFGYATFGPNMWRTENVVLSNQYQNYSSKNMPHITFEQSSKLAIHMLNNN